MFASAGLSLTARLNSLDTCSFFTPSPLASKLYHKLFAKQTYERQKKNKKRLGPSAKECGLIQSPGKKEEKERLRGEKGGSKKRDKKDTEGEKSRATEWRRKCQEASLGGKFRGGQDGKRPGWRGVKRQAEIRMC